MLSDNLSSFTLGALLGGMGFFSFLVAPTAFATLAADSAGRFVRAMFPHYYLFVIALSLLAAVALIGPHEYLAIVMVCCAALGALSRQVLMPRINALRDRSLAGDAGAGRWFDRLHKVSFGVNVVQLAAVATVMALHV